MMATEDEPKIAGSITGGEARPGQEPVPVLDPLDPDLLRKQALKDHAAVALLEIGLYQEACKRHAELAGREMELEANRPAAKLNAVLRLLQLVNPASGEKQTKYSKTDAESAAALDHEYRAHLQLQSEVVQAKNQAFTDLESARLRAELAITRLRAESGMR